MPLSDSVVLKKLQVVRALSDIKDRRRLIGPLSPLFELKIFDVSQFVVARQSPVLTEVLRPITFVWRRVGQFKARLLINYDASEPNVGSSIVELSFQRSVERVSNAFSITLKFGAAGKTPTDPVLIPDRIQAILVKLAKLRRQRQVVYRQPPATFGAFSRSTSKRKNPETRSGTCITRTETQSSPGTDGTFTYSAYSRTWSGTVTPGFRDKRGSQLPQNAHSCEIRSTKDGQAIYADYWTNSNFWTVQTSSCTQLFNNAGEVAAPAFSHSASALSRALRKVVGKSQSDINNVAQDFTQYHQTVKMIANTASRLTGAISDLKRGNIAGVISSLFHGKARFRSPGGPSVSKSLASNWLEFQYGWKPLLADVRATMEATAQYVARSPPYRRVSASATNLETVRSSIFGVQPWAIGSREVIRRSTSRYGFRYVVEDDFKVYLQKLGFTNPINLAWEVIPYSFVVDWFFPLGPYLETLSAWQGLKFLDGYLVQFTKQSTRSTVSLTHKQWNPSIPEFGDFYGAYDDEWIKFNRSKLSAFPEARFPQIKNPIGVTHALNALALLRVAFRK